MKKLVVTILVSLVLSGCAKNKSQNDFIINKINYFDNNIMKYLKNNDIDA